MTEATRTEEAQTANRSEATTPEQRLTEKELEGIVGGVIGDGGCPTAQYPDLDSPEDKSDPVSNK